MTAKTKMLDPKDFYFFVGTDPLIKNLIETGVYSLEEVEKNYVTTTIAVIIPIKYWDLYYSRLDIDLLLPVYMKETLNGQYESSRSVEETSKDLVSNGFIESEEFSSFCNWLISNIEIRSDIQSKMDIN